MRRSPLPTDSRPCTITMSEKPYTRATISTRYMGPTNHRGPRYAVVSANGHHLTVDQDDSLGIQENHARAAAAMAQRLAWVGEWEMGSTPDGYVFTLRTPEPAFTVVPSEGHGAPR